MRKLLSAALLIGLVFGAVGPVCAGEQEAALAVVERAIKAHGGAEGLAKVPLSSRTSSGVLSIGPELPFTSEVVMSLPDKVRLTMVVNKVPLITVINGDRGWQQSGGMTAELPKSRVEEIREEAHLWWLATLLPLKRSEFLLKPLPDIKVNGKPAVGVQATSKGHPDTKLYFDKDSGLLVKIERRAREAGLLVDKEYLYSGHKDFGGVRLPTKEVMNINGKKATEVNISAYRFPQRVEDAKFARP